MTSNSRDTSPLKGQVTTTATQGKRHREPGSEFEAHYITYWNHVISPRHLILECFRIIEELNS